MNKKLMTGGMMLWASGTVMLVVCFVIYTFVMEHCTSMGCIPAMLAMMGMVMCAPAPILLVLSILILKNQKWAIGPYNTIVTILVILMVLGMIGRIKAEMRQREVDRGVQRHKDEVEAANKATYNLLPGLTTYDAVIEILGQPPVEPQERYGVGLLVFYYNEAMCAKMQRTQLEITFDSETKRIINYNCR